MEGACWLGRGRDPVTAEVQPGLAPGGSVLPPLLAGSLVLISRAFSACGELLQLCPTDHVDRSLLMVVPSLSALIVRFLSELCHRRTSPAVASPRGAPYRSAASGVSRRGISQHKWDTEARLPSGAVAPLWWVSASWQGGSPPHPLLPQWEDPHPFPAEEEGHALQALKWRKC